MDLDRVRERRDGVIGIARDKGREMAGSQPGVLIEAFGEICAEGARIAADAYEANAALIEVIDGVRMRPVVKISDDYDLVDEWQDWNRSRTDAEPYIGDSLSMHCLRTLIREQIEMSIVAHDEAPLPSPALTTEGA